MHGVSRPEEEAGDSEGDLCSEPVHWQTLVRVSFRSFFFQSVCLCMCVFVSSGKSLHELRSHPPKNHRETITAAPDPCCESFHACYRWVTSQQLLSHTVVAAAATGATNSASVRGSRAKCSQFEPLVFTACCCRCTRSRRGHNLARYSVVHRVERCIAQRISGSSLLYQSCSV